MKKKVKILIDILEDQVKQIRSGDFSDAKTEKQFYCLGMLKALHELGYINDLKLAIFIQDMEFIQDHSDILP